MASPFKTIKYDPENKAEWLALRDKGVGGSDAGIIAGVNPFKTQHELYLEKRGLMDAPDLSDNQAVHFGNVLEDVVANEYAERTGQKVRRNNCMLQSVEFPYMLANLDREVVGSKKILECKTAGAFMMDAWGEEGTDQVPDSYLLQTQHYLAVTGKELADLAVLIGGRDFRIYTIPRDETLIKSLRTLEGVFWRHVERQEPPEIQFDHASTADLLARKYPGTDGSVLHADAKLDHWAFVEREAAAKEAEYKKIKEGAKNHIKAAAGESSIVMFDDGRGYTRKLTKKKGFVVEPSESMNMRYNKDVTAAAEKLEESQQKLLETANVE